MILVDVYVPALDKTFDFRLDEKAKVGQIMIEMQDIFKKKLKESGDKKQDFMLCSMEQKEELPIYKTLSECRIKDGSRLMLV